MLCLFHWQTHINKSGIRPESSLGVCVCVRGQICACMLASDRDREGRQRKKKKIARIILGTSGCIYMCVCVWCIWPMENGPDLIQQLYNVSIARKQEQSLFYSCVRAYVCVVGWQRIAQLCQLWHWRRWLQQTAQSVIRETTLCINTERVCKREKRDRGLHRQWNGPDWIKGIHDVFRLVVSGSTQALSTMCLNEKVYSR